MSGCLVRAIGVLMMLTALGVALSRAPDRPVQALIARWGAPPSEFIDLRGQLVHLRDEGPRGDALPIVLLHGTASSLHTWAGWAQGLRAQRRVISFDLPGFGLSGPNADGRYSAARDAAVVLELMDALGVRRFVLAGHSLGGDVAWQVAERAPGRVERLILVDAAGLGGEGPPAPSALLARVPLLGRVAEHLLPREAVAIGLRRLYGDPRRLTAETVDRYFELALREGNRRALQQRLAQSQPPAADVPARLARLRLPALVLWGEDDRLLAPALGEAWARALPQARLVRLPGLGHLPQEEDAAQSLAALRPFIDAPASGPPR